MEIGHSSLLFSVTDKRIHCHFSFFPLAGSPHCTRESCLFRDAIGLTPIFSELQAIVIGISQDPPERSKKFVDEHHLGYRILHDENREAMDTYGVKRSMMGLIDQRCTFVIDPAGLVRGMAQGVWDSRGHLKFAESWLIRLEHELSQRSRQYVEYAAGAGDLIAGFEGQVPATQVIYGDRGSARGGGIGGVPRYGARSMAGPATMVPMPAKVPRGRRGQSKEETEQEAPGLERGWKSWKNVLANLNSPDHLPPPAAMSSPPAINSRQSDTYVRRPSPTLVESKASEEKEKSSSASLYSKKSSKSNPAKTLSKRSRSFARDGLKRLHRSQSHLKDESSGGVEEVPPVPPMITNLDTGEAKYEDGESQDSYTTFQTGSSSKRSTGSTAATSHDHGLMGGNANNVKLGPTTDLGNGWSKAPITNEVMMVTNEGYSSSARTPRGAIASISGGPPVMRRKPVPGSAGSMGSIGSTGSGSGSGSRSGSSSGYGYGSFPLQPQGLAPGPRPASRESRRSLDTTRGRRRPVPVPDLERSSRPNSSAAHRAQDEEATASSVENGSFESGSERRPGSKNSSQMDAMSGSRPSSASSRKLAPTPELLSSIAHQSPLVESVRTPSDEARESLIFSSDAPSYPPTLSTSDDAPTVRAHDSSQDTTYHYEAPETKRGAEAARGSEESARSEIMPSPVHSTVDLHSTIMVARRINGNAQATKTTLKDSPIRRQHRRNTSTSSAASRESATPHSSSRAQTPTMMSMATSPQAAAHLGTDDASSGSPLVIAGQYARSRRQSSDDGSLKARTMLPRKTPPPMQAPPPPTPLPAPPPSKDDVGTSPALLFGLVTNPSEMGNGKDPSSEESPVKEPSDSPQTFPLDSAEDPLFGSPTGYSSSSRRQSLADSIRSDGTFG